MKIGILTAGKVAVQMVSKHCEYAGMFAKMLDGHGFSFENYDVVDGVFPNSIHDCDGWLITRSPKGTYEDHHWIPPLEDFVGAAYTADVPVIGICFGHQVMAQAFGGKVEKFTGGWGLGNSVYELVGDTEKNLLAIHQDQVVEKPKEATVIASNDFCKYAGFAYRGKAMSFQPHPEMTSEFVRELIKIRAGVVFPQELADAALANADQPHDSDEIAKQMAEFYLANRSEIEK